MRYLLLAILLVLSQDGFTTEFNCEDVIGKWTSTRFDSAINSYLTITSEYEDDLSLIIKFDIVGEYIKENQIEKGIWYCSGNRIYTKITSIDGKPTKNSYVYLIEYLDSSYMVTTSDVKDCQMIVGECKPKRFEGTRAN